MMMYAMCVPFDERRASSDTKYRNYKQEIFENTIKYPTGGSNGDE
jgi:hypothetical protein